MLFGEKLRAMRENANLTQAELGKLIGVSDRVVGYYEADVRFPKKPYTLQRISEVFDVSIDSLLGKEESFIQKSVEQFVYTGNKQAKELLTNVQALFAGGELPEEDQDEFFRMVTQMYIEAKNNNKKYGRKQHTE
jgi:transcriptional regulator with XRE-family HTH domain